MLAQKCSRVAYFFTSLQLSAKSTYGAATINTSCGFAVNTNFRPKSGCAGAANGNTVACGRCGGREKKRERLKFLSTVKGAKILVSVVDFATMRASRRSGDPVLH